MNERVSSRVVNPEPKLPKQESPESQEKSFKDRVRQSLENSLKVVIFQLSKEKIKNSFEKENYQELLENIDKYPVDAQQKILSKVYEKITSNPKFVLQESENKIKVEEENNNIASKDIENLDLLMKHIGKIENINKKELFQTLINRNIKSAFEYADFFGDDYDEENLINELKKQWYGAQIKPYRQVVDNTVLINWSKFSEPDRNYLINSYGANTILNEPVNDRSSRCAREILAFQSIDSKNEDMSVVRNKLGKKIDILLTLDQYLSPSDIDKLISEMQENKYIDGTKYISILEKSKTITPEQRDILINSLINSKYTFYLEKIEDTLTPEQKDNYEKACEKKYLTEKNLKKRISSIKEKIESESDEKRKALLEKVLEGLNYLDNFEETFRSQTSDSTLKGRVVDHMLLKMKSSVRSGYMETETALQDLASEMGIEIIDLLGYLQVDLNRIFQSAEMYHGSKPQFVEKLFSEGRFKHAIENPNPQNQEIRGTLNAEFETQHYGEEYKNAEINQHLIFGFLSSNNSGYEYSTRGYGPVRYKFNKEKIEDRTTIYLGDTTGASHAKHTPQSFRYPHISFLIDTFKGTRSEKFNLEEMDDFISNSKGTGYGNAFLEVNIHNQAHVSDIEEVIIDTSKVSKHEISTIERSVEEYNRVNGTNIVVRLTNNEQEETIFEAKNKKLR